MANDARLAGALHLSLVPFGIFSFGYVPAALIDRGDAAETVRNIATAPGFYRSGIISHLISQVIVIFLMMALYRLFSPIDRSRSRLIVAFGLVSVAISVVAEFNQFAVLTQLSSAQQVMHLLEMHRAGVLLAQIFWASWLAVMATLIFKTGTLPRWLGALLLVSVAGYLFDSLTYFAGRAFASISQFTFFGELMLPACLVLNGVRPSVAAS